MASYHPLEENLNKKDPDFSEPPGAYNINWMEPRDIIVTYIIRPDLFWVIAKDSDVRNEIENMEDEPPRTFNHDIGSIVMAKIGKRWCRVELQILQHTPQGRIYKGFLIDYGTYESITTSTIRTLPLKYKSMDPQAIKVKLSGISAAKRTVDFSNKRINFEYSHIWTQAAYTYIRKMVDNSSNTKIIPYELKDKDVLIADVIFEIYDNEINLGQQLIQECYALPKDDSTWNNEELVHSGNYSAPLENSIVMNESSRHNKSLFEEKRIKISKTDSHEKENTEEEEIITKTSEATDKEDFIIDQEDVEREVSPNREESNNPCSHCSLTNYPGFETNLNLISANISQRDLATTECNYSYSSINSLKNEKNIPKEEKANIANVSISRDTSDSCQKSINPDPTFPCDKSKSFQRMTNASFSNDDFNKSPRTRDNAISSFSDTHSRDTPDNISQRGRGKIFNASSSNISEIGIGRGRIFNSSFSNSLSNISQRGEVKRANVATSSNPNSSDDSDTFENTISHMGMGRAKFFNDLLSKQRNLNISQRVGIERSNDLFSSKSNSSGNCEFPRKIRRGKVLSSSINSNSSQIGSGRGKIPNVSLSNTINNVSETSPTFRSTSRGKCLENLTQNVSVRNSGRLIKNCTYIFIPAGRCLGDYNI